MPQLPTISDAEWEVMNVLWSTAPAPMSASQVVDAVATRMDWSPRTVKTLLNRLIKKRALSFDRDGKSYLYRPAVGRDQCVRAETRSFLSRVFGGAAGPMLAHFVEHADLSTNEVEQLQRLLREKRAAIEGKPTAPKAR